LTILARQFSSTGSALCHRLWLHLSGRRARPVYPPKRHDALVRGLSGTAPSELTTLVPVFCLSAQCRDPSPDRRLGHRASPSRTAGEVEASPGSDSATDCRAQLEERRRPVLGIAATLSPSHRCLPRRCITALQSSLAPTQARCCSDAHLPKKASTKISTRSRRGATAPAPRPRSALPRSPRGPPVQARPKSSPPERAPRPPQGPDADDKKWPRRRPNPYGSAAAPPSASPRKRGARFPVGRRGHARKATVLGVPKNAP